MKSSRALLFFLGVFCASLLQAGRVVSVADFGAVPNDGVNDVSALRRAAAYCRSHRGVKLVFPSGVYHLRDENAVEIERQAISGALGSGLEVQNQLFQPQKPYVTGLDFTGCRDLTIEADGAVLCVEGWMQVLSFVKAQNISVTGLTITMKRPAATEAKVVAKSEGSFDVEFDPSLYCYIDSIVQGRLYFYSDYKKRFYYGGANAMELVRPGLVRMKSNLNPSINDYCIIRYGGHYRPCVMVKESRNIFLKNLSILSFPGMGVVGHLSENILIDGLKVVPEPGRLSSTNTDATHFTSCSGTLTIQNSVFKGNGDDCTNVHNYYYYAYPQSDMSCDVEIKVENADLHAQSLDYPMRGDTMLLVDRNSMQTRGSFIVRDVDTSSVDWRVNIKLNKPLSTAEAQSCFLLNHTRFPKVRILHNTVYYHNGRAFLLKVPHSEVIGNTIENTTLTAIKLGAELSWHEGGPVEYALVENNYVAHCGEEGGDGTASCVMVTTEARSTPPFVNRHIIIRNNVFETQQPIAILLCDAEDVDISDNWVNNLNYVKTENCQRIHVSEMIHP